MDGEVTLARLVTLFVELSVEFVYYLSQVSSIVSRLIANAFKTL